MDMNKNLEIMIDSLARAFPNLTDIDSRVNNIKERIFLVQKTIASRPQPGGRGSEPKSKPQVITKDDTNGIDDALKRALARLK